MKEIISSLIIIFIPAFIGAQTPDTVWTKTFGGGSDESGGSVQMTSDGGFIIMGNTQSFGAGMRDEWLLKTNESGDSLWSNTFGGTGTEFGSRGEQTADGGYIFIGSTNSFGAGNYDFYLVKTDSAGTLLWSSTFGGTGIEYGQSVQTTYDKGYILGGHTSSFGAGSNDFYMVKTDSLGNLSWSKTFGGTGGDIGNSVRQTSDSGYVMTGYTLSFGAGGYDVWLVKTDASGDTLWTRTYGGSSHDRGSIVIQTADSGYAVVGNTSSFGAGSADIWLIKTGISGVMQWSQTYGGTGLDDASSIKQTIDGGYIIAGYTDSFGAGANDIWVIKTDEVGDTLWTRTYGGTANETSGSIYEISDREYILTGTTSSFGAGGSDAWLLRISQQIPVISVEPDTIDFGDVLIDDAACLGLTITNNGSADLIINEITSTDSSFVVDVICLASKAAMMDSLYIIPPNSDLLLPVALIPRTAGSYLDTLTLFSNDPLNPELQVILQGTGVVGEHGLSASQLDFGNVNVGESKPDTLFVINLSTADIMIYVTVPESDEFSSFPYGELIRPGDSLSVAVTFSPSAEAEYSDYLIVNGPAAKDSVELIGSGVIVGIVNSETLPDKIQLHQNYPNPFNPVTEIKYDISVRSYLSLVIYNLLGEEVARLIDGEQNSGYHAVRWDASSVASGVYFYRLEVVGRGSISPTFVQTKKMVLLK